MHMSSARHVSSARRGGPERVDMDWGELIQAVAGAVAPRSRGRQGGRQQLGQEEGPRHGRRKGEGAESADGTRPW